LDDTTIIALGILGLIAGMFIFAMLFTFKPYTTVVEFERDAQGRVVRIIERVR